MDEKIKDVMAKYDLQVHSMYRVRGAYVFDTNKGQCILREYRGLVKKAETIQKIKEKIVEQGNPYIDLYERNKEGKLLTENCMGTPYVLKHWFCGEDCDLKNPEHLVLAAENLAHLHSCMKNCLEQSLPFQADTVEDTLVKHNRELRRVRTYIREKKQRNAFELFFLSLFSEFYQEAEYAEDMLKQVNMSELYDKVFQEQTFCHGSYNYHNLIMLPQGVATMDFEKTHLQLQVLDLYDLARKLMEKSGWNSKWLRTLLVRYHQIRPLSQAEKKILKIKLCYPEKFWKITNHYYNRKKSWISGKNIEKLQSLQQQKLARQKLIGKLGEIFDF